MEESGEEASLLSRIYARPALAQELSREERVAAFSQLMFVAGPIMSAMLKTDDLKTPDFALADDLWTARETAARLRINVRTLYAGIKSGRYPFAVADGRNIRISRLGFQRWLKLHSPRS